MSVGTYVTLNGAKARLFGSSPSTDAARDTLLQSFCDETNDFVESIAERVLAPVPTFSSTFTGTAGASVGTVASATGLNVGDDLLLGLISGSHEHGEVMAVSGLTVTLRTALANSYAGAACQRIYVQDGFGALGYDDYPGGTWLPFGQVGIVNLAALEVATTTPPTSPFGRIPQTDYFLRPSPPQPGWPYEGVEMTNIPSPGNTSPVFYPGFDNVRLIGPGPCVGLADATGFGFPATPQDVVGVAYNALAGRWQMRTSGGSYEANPGSDNVAIGNFLLSRTDYLTLQRYKLKTLSIV